MELCRWSFDVWMNELDRSRVYGEISGSVGTCGISGALIDSSAVSGFGRLRFDSLTVEICR